MGSLSSPHKLDVIELSAKNLEPGTESWSKTCKQVVSALEKHGCFVASYDKITQETHSAVFQGLEELFDLPIQTKVQNKSTKPLYGYVGGQMPFMPLYESMGIDDANTLDGIRSFIKVMWPNGNNNFSENLLRYTKLAAELEKIVMRMVFESYGVGDYYESHIESANYLCRVMKYREPKTNENNLGFVPHTDKSFMSMIHQNQVDGLEIKSENGEWFGVRDLSHSSIVFMAGDAMMAWSNNRIKSAQHKVTMDGKKTRYSIAQFSYMEKTIETPKELVDKDHPLQYKPFDHYKFLEFYTKEENRGLHENAIKTYCGV